MISLDQHHIFNNHLLAPIHQKGLELVNDSESIWISAYLLAGLAILTTVKKYSLQNLIRNIQFGFGFQTLRKFERIEAGTPALYTQLLNIFFILNMAYLAFVFNKTYDFLQLSQSFPIQLFFFIGFSLIILAIKAFINGLLKSVSSKGKAIQEYQNISYSINRVLGLFLFPLLLLLGFSEFDPQFIIILCLALVVLMLLVKWLKGILLSLGEEGIGILQILTYFCALEILPQLLLVKFTIETFKAG